MITLYFQAMHSKDLSGAFLNRSEDIQIILENGEQYDFQRGSPLNVPRERRYVDFEWGDILVKGKSISLKPRQVFKSPGRWSYYEYMSEGLQSGLERYIPRKVDQERFRKELTWRLKTSGKEHSIQFAKNKGRIQLIFEGVVLTKAKSELSPKSKRQSIFK
jgi:hypothetical protein